MPTQHDPERHEPLLCAVVKIALEPPALLVARPHDPRSRLLHLGELEPHLDSEARDLDREARGVENAAEQIGAVEQGALVAEEPDLLSSVLHRRDGAPVAEQGSTTTAPRPSAYASLAGSRKSSSALGSRRADGEHGPDLLRLAPSLTNVVDECAHASQPLVARAVEAPVHHSLSAAPQRPEGSRDDEDREGRHPGRAPPDRDTCEERNERVHQAEQRSDDAVDERPVDQSIDLVQAGSASRPRRPRSRRQPPFRARPRPRPRPGLADREAPDEEPDDPQRDQQRRIRQPEHLQPLDPFGAPVATPDRGSADDEAREDRQPGHGSQEAEGVRQPNRNRIRHIRERRSRARSASTSATTRSVIELAAKSAYGRHRRDGSRPSGNTNVTASGQAKKTGHSEETRAAHEPPGSDPGCASSATDAYGLAASTAASDSAPTTRIQPIGLRACRATINAPTTAGAETAATRNGYNHQEPASGNVLFGRDPVEHHPSRDHGQSHDRQAPGNRTKRSPHAIILVQRCPLGHSATTDPPGAAAISPR